MHTHEVLEYLLTQIRSGRDSDTTAMSRGLPQEDYWRAIGSIQRCQRIEQQILDLGRKLQGDNNG